MLRDLKEAKSTEFCAEMNVYWLYDVNHDGFAFAPHTLIPKTKLFKYSNFTRIGSYDFVPVPEREATEIESWENFNSTKIVFFVLSSGVGYVNVKIERFIWYSPYLSYDSEGTIQINHEEGCREPSFYQYKVIQ
jgi:hypothetical protein